MSKFKVLGLALVAVLALSALASASAFGAVKGELVNSSGAAVKGKITLAQKTSQVLETLAGVKVTCTSANGEGEASSTTNASIKGVTFKGCTKSTGGKCKTVGAAAEEIKIGQLNVEAERNAGLTEDLVLTELASEVEFECAEVKIKVKGGGKFVATVTPQGTLTKSFTLAASCSSAGMQALTSYTNHAGTAKTISEAEGLLTKIGTGAFEGSCQAGEATATLAEEGKLV
jgi:hypothetical protein